MEEKARFGPTSKRKRERSLTLTWIFFGSGASSGMVYQQCTVAMGMAVYRLYSACGFVAYGGSCFPSTVGMVDPSTEKSTVWRRGRIKVWDGIEERRFGGNFF
jgi:hypothetical protein